MEKTSSKIVVAFHPKHEWILTSPTTAPKA
jgi:hypothetical protein